MTLIYDHTLCPIEDAPSWFPLFRTKGVAVERACFLSYAAGHGPEVIEYEWGPYADEIRLYTQRDTDIYFREQNARASAPAHGSLGGPHLSLAPGSIHRLMGAPTPLSALMKVYAQLLSINPSSLQYLSEPTNPPLDASVPSTLGWRYWYFNPIEDRLQSPIQHTIWHDAELRCTEWSEETALRGAAGIHARLVPEDWTNAASNEVPPAKGWSHYEDGHLNTPTITGIVERFDRFVLGTEGWRAKWVIIRKLYAPTLSLHHLLSHAYPEVEVLPPNPKEPSDGNR